MTHFLLTAPEDSLLYVGSYNPVLVVISILLAMLASYAALSVSARIKDAENTLQKMVWIVMGSLAMGSGVWAMHFIGMLAWSLPCVVSYDPLLTYASMLPSLLACGVALNVINKEKAGKLSLLVGSLLLGAGIGTMHFTGMFAMRLNGFVYYNPYLFAVSILVAVLLAYVALTTQFGILFLKKRREVYGAIILGGAVSGMHYTAMSAAYFVRGDVAQSADVRFSTDYLALEVALITTLMAALVIAVSAVYRKFELDRVLRNSEERFRTLTIATSQMVWSVNADGYVLEDVPTWCAYTGQTLEQAKGRGWAAAVHPDDVENTLLLWTQAREQSSIFQADCRIRRYDGVYRFFTVRGVPICNSSGAIREWIGTCIDITEHKEHVDSLRLSALIWESSSEGMMVTDERNLIVAVNSAFTMITGYRFEEVRGKNPHILSSGKHDQSFYVAMWQKLVDTGHWQGEIWNQRKNGEIYVQLVTINMVRNEAGAVERYVALLTDITEKKQAEELIWQQANFDALTHLPNRRMFRNRIEQELLKVDRANSSMALLLIDLDKFKEVNDTLGHDMGDVLLKEAALRLASCVRESDSVARLGGDEFAVLITALADVRHAEGIAQKIIVRMAEPFNLGNEVAFISASVGIALYPDDADDLESLMKSADQAMYEAKKHGRNRFSYFTSALQEAAQRRLRITNELRGALAGNQLRVYYQPIVDLSSGHIHKAEALIRWLHPERGMVSPVEFISLAEETGLIIDIGFWVFQEAARQVKQWQILFDETFQISVNRSPVQFQNHSRNSESLCIDYLEELHLTEQSIVFEITEGLLLDANVTESLLRFRDAGIQVALDDFGTGYSSLSYLKKFDIDFLKIDKSFVDNLTTDASDVVLCEAIIVMAHKLGLKVIAEGIETEQQRQILLGAGCDFGQGYLFSRPVPAADFEKLLQH